MGMTTIEVPHRSRRGIRHGRTESSLVGFPYDSRRLVTKRWAVRASLAWRAPGDLLTSVPGIGGHRRTLIEGSPEPAHLSRRRVATLVDVAPASRDSGQWRDHRGIAGGEPQSAMPSS